MSKQSNYFKQIVVIFSITIFFYLFLDFLIGNKILNLFETKYNNQQVNTNKPTLKNKDFKYNFKKNLNQYVSYGPYNYQICTNEISIRINCNEKEKSKDYEILFIGDSFTEGVGLPYVETFVGIFQKERNYNVANLAVSGYSPYIYYKKILAYENIINFHKVREIIVFIDISDNQDDLKYQNINFEGSKNPKKINNKISLNSIKIFLRNIFPLSYEALFQIKNYKLPKPRYRYHQNYGKSAWTYKNEILNDDFRKGIKENIKNMEKLHKFLVSKNIKLSIAVYPWPNTLIYDNLTSKHVKIWKNFCLNKCKNFINYFPIFFDKKNSLSLEEAKIIINRNYLKYDMHFNINGHKKISEHLIDLY